MFYDEIVDYISSMNCNRDSLIDNNCFWILWIWNCWVDIVMHDGIEMICVMPKL